MGSPASILDLRRQTASHEIIGPTIFASAFFDGTGNRGWIVTSPSEAIADIAQVKQQGWDFIKVYNSIKTNVFQNSPYIHNSSDLNQAFAFQKQMVRAFNDAGIPILSQILVVYLLILIVKPKK